jgi:7-carboxy-7-deazaguanine synthase
MLTGGSPTMHPALVNELTHFANERDILITIETEGSHFIATDYPIGLISLSPKKLYPPTFDGLVINLLSINICFN